VAAADSREKEAGMGWIRKRVRECFPNLALLHATQIWFGHHGGESMVDLVTTELCD
jgi:hypothetical protein